DGDWVLLGAPRIGWAAVIRPDLQASRVTSGALILVAGLLGLMLGGREARLVREARESGTRLDFALRAGGMGAWEWDARTGRVTRSAAAKAIIEGPTASADSHAEEVFLDRVHPDDRAMVHALMRELES